MLQSELRRLLFFCMFLTVAVNMGFVGPAPTAQEIP